MYKYNLGNNIYLKRYLITLIKDSPLKPIILINNIGKVKEINRKIFTFQSWKSKCRMEKIRIDQTRFKTKVE